MTTVVAIKPTFLNRDKVAEIIDVSVDTIERMVQAGEFPKPRQVGKKSVRWFVPEIEAWAESRPVSSNLPVANCGGRA